MDDDELLNHYRKAVETMRGDIATFEAREMMLYKMTPQGREDITEEWLSEMRRRADNLERVIAAHERRKKSE
jgi:hypothetical protein